MYSTAGNRTVASHESRSTRCWTEGLGTKHWTCLDRRAKGHGKEVHVSTTGQDQFSQPPNPNPSNWALGTTRIGSFAEKALRARVRGHPEIIDFLQGIVLPTKLGQCTPHLHDTPYYLRPHCDVSELSCVVVIIQILGTPLLQVDHQTTTPTKAKGGEAVQSDSARVHQGEGWCKQAELRSAYLLLPKTQPVCQAHQKKNTAAKWNN
jgi:hypothetical protein